MRRLVFAVAAAATLYAAPASARYQGGDMSGGPDFSQPLLTVHLIPASYWGHYGFGFGGRYEFKLVPRGFLPRGGRLRITDDLSMDAGFDFIHANYGSYIVDVDPYTGRYVYEDLTFNAFVPTVGVLWNVHLTPRLTVYPKIDTGAFIGWWSESAYYSDPHVNVFFVQGAVGLTYDIGAMRLKGEIGSGMIKLGLQFEL